ncbi:neutral ceramidase 2-like protein [Tanacetum coccineum]
MIAYWTGCQGQHMTGYANLDQRTAGIHFCLRARAFIVAESLNGQRVVFVNLYAGIKVLERLSERIGKFYNEDNLAISGTNSHAGLGGYLQYVLYSVTSRGFIPQSFDVIVTAIEMINTLNFQQQKKQSKLCETYKQSYNAKPKYALENQPKTTTRQIKEKMLEFKIKKPEESSSNWKPWHKD